MNNENAKLQQSTIDVLIGHIDCLVMMVKQCCHWHNNKHELELDS
jgi:hypothetical protein